MFPCGEGGEGTFRYGGRVGRLWGVARGGTVERSAMGMARGDKEEGRGARAGGGPP